MRPFLKWAGSKRQLLPELRRFVPREFRAYHEPFFGSGALFFDLVERGRLHGKRACAIDHNADLIGCYVAIRERVEEVVGWLQVLAAAHAAAPEQMYYRVRDQLFNPGRRLFVASGSRPDRYGADLAAMFIYLNRTGFNGLFRQNSRGEFNVPAGRYVNPLICDEPNLRAVSAALRTTGVALRPGPFDAVRDAARPGDFVYFDPPYAPLSTTANFTAYTSSRFGEADQRRLQEVMIDLARRGCHVVLSNSTAQLIKRLYGSEESRDAGLRLHTVQARRLINSDSTRRGQISEYIITNVTPEG